MRSDDKELEPTVSVLVPVYNGQKYIRDFLESIREQTYRSIELIIVDDCSKDQSYDICRKWCKENESRFDRIKLNRNSNNLGLTENTNILFSLAAGKYLFLADQDDVWLSDKIRRQTQYMDKHDKCMLSLTDRSVTDERLNIKLESEFRHNGYSIISMDLNEYLAHRVHGTSANKMCIRNGYPDVLKVPSDVLEHDRFIASMAVCLGTIDYIYEPLTLYRIHSLNLSGNYCIQTSHNIIECFYRLYRAKKRVRGRHGRDNIIIKEEMKKRFNITVDENKSRFFITHDDEQPILKSAWNEALKAYKAGRIGEWR